MADFKKIEEGGYRLPASWKEGAAPAENKAESDLKSKTKAELVAMADERGVEVTRSDGTELEPVKADYVKALGG